MRGLSRSRIRLSENRTGGSGNWSLKYRIRIYFSLGIILSKKSRIVISFAVNMFGNSSGFLGEF